MLIKRTAPKEFNINNELATASNMIGNLKNYFSSIAATHVPRKQTDEIINWINTERLGIENLEKLLVIKGNKGVGKSTIIADSYRNLALNYKLFCSCHKM